MPYNQSVYENMTDYDYYGGKMKGGSKMHSGRFKYDKGYTGKYDSRKGAGDSYMYKERGNDYSSIQDRIAKENHSKMKPQMHNNY